MVAAGVFGPGHLGELTRVISFELVDAVLAELAPPSGGCGCCPPESGLYFVLGLVLFPRPGYRGVWAKLTAALDGLVLAVRPESAVDLRLRIGAAPLKALFEVLAGPLAWPRTPGVHVWPVPDGGLRRLPLGQGARHAAEQGLAGQAGRLAGRAGYPVIQLMTLCETGTRALIGAVFGTPADGEVRWACKLLCLLDASMLVLMDRGFDAGEFLAEVHATKAQFLVRLLSVRRPPVLRRFPDGSCCRSSAASRSGSSPPTVTVTCHDGTRYGDSYRLATTILDWRAYPAGALIRCTTSGGNTRSPTSPCGTPCSTGGSCARATRPAWNRRYGHCWPCTRRCGSPSPTPSRPSRTPTPTGPATRSPSRPPRTS